MSASPSLTPQQQEQLNAVRAKYSNLSRQLVAKYNDNVTKVNRSNFSIIVKRNMIEGLTKAVRRMLQDLINQLKTETETLLAQFAAQNAAVASASSSTASVRKALLVGINYLNTSSQLSGCINDAKELQKWLLTRKFDASNITLITDETVLKPTRQTILQQFQLLLQSAKAGDTLFFAYSGHGSFQRDVSGDEKDGRDETIVAVDFQMIQDDEFKQLLDRHMKEGVTLIALFDSCHSGSMLDLKYTYLDSTSGNADTQNAINKECAGTVLCLTGCMDNQYSGEAWTGKAVQGAMTVCFLAGVQNNQITWRQLVQQMRQQLIDAGYNNQQPQFSSDGSYNLDTTISSLL